MALNDISNIEESPLNAYEVTYGELPPEVERYMSMPGANPSKVLEWFNLGLQEPQTYNQAKLLAEAVGYNPEQAKVVAAQWQMESSGGSKLSSPYNYFGIKSHNEAVRNKLAERGIIASAGKQTDTTEGKGKATKSSFMEFNNAFEGFAAHKAFLESNNRYQKALASSTAKDFAVGLEKAGYATAPNYGTTLYQSYIAPKEKNPKSGDVRPKSLGQTKSEKIKPFTMTSDLSYQEGVTPVAPMRLESEPQIGLEPTIGQGMYGSIPYQQKVEETKAIPMNAPAGFFGSGKTMFKQGGTMNFKSPGAYHKWLGYVHATGLAESTPGHQKVSIGGKPHKVEHQYGGHMYAAGGSFNNPGFKALPAEVQNKIRANSFAEGGTIGGQLTEFNAGGRHEENPLGGIPQGTAPDGQVNLVEQGETKLDSANYIFSDTLKVTKEIAEGLNLPNSLVGKTFAEASKKLNLDKSRRENDTIENNYKEKMLNTLMEAQEIIKAEQKAKDFAMMAEKYPQEMGAMMQAMQGGAPGGEMMAGAPQQMPEQGMPTSEPVPNSQLPMSYGGSMYMRGGKMCADGGSLYNYGGNLYDFGGTMRSIGAGAYGVGEGMLDTLTFGLTDKITDKGYDALSNIGDRTQEEIDRDKMIRGFGNTAGAITGAVVTGGATTGSAISEGSEGLGEGLTNIKGTGEKFDKIVNTLAQVGSMAGGLVGGNPTAAAGSPEFTQNLMSMGQNPMLNQGLGMAGMRKEGGPLYHQYPPASTHWKNNAGPMGQGLANTQVYAMGGHMYNGITNPTGFLGFKPKGISYTPQAENLMNNPFLQDQSYLGLGETTDFTGAGKTGMTNKTAGAFDVDPTLTDATQDLSVTGTPLGILSQLAPIAYNTYMAFKKPKQYSPSDFYVEQQAIRPDYTEAYNEARNTYAQMVKGLGQTGLSGGARAANLANASFERNKAMGQVAMAEENAYLEDQMRVRGANAAGLTGAKQMALQTEWAQKAAQQEHGKEAINQFKQMQEADLANKIAMKYVQAGAPDMSKFNKTGYTPYGEYFKQKYFPKKGG